VPFGIIFKDSHSDNKVEPTQQRGRAGDEPDYFFIFLLDPTPQKIVFTFCEFPSHVLVSSKHSQSGRGSSPKICRWGERASLLALTRPCLSFVRA
jgi:hypothetical protein